MRRGAATDSIQRLLVYCVLIGCAFFITAPVWFMIAGSLKPDDEVLKQAGSLRAVIPTNPSLENYRDVFNRVPFDRFLLNSIFINAGVVVLGILINAPCGYALARLGPPFEKGIMVFILAMLVIPFESIAIPLFYQLSALGWRDSYFVQIAPFIANPLSIYLFYSFFLNLPKGLEEAAYMDGAGTLRTFVTIVIPNAKPVFAAVTIVTFLFNWGAYLWPLLMTTRADVRPLPLAIATFHTLPPLKWGDIMAFGVMMVAPVLIVFAVFQRWFVQGVASSGFKG